MDIKLFREATYPEVLLGIMRSLVSFEDSIISNSRSDENLAAYFDQKRWHPGHPTGALIRDVSIKLSEHNIIAYHNTRLDGEESVRKNGLFYADDRYLNYLKATYARQSISNTIEKEIIGAIVNEQKRWLDNPQSMRGRQVCYFYDFSYYEAYDKFLAFFGGEFVEFGLSLSNGRIPLKYKKAVTLGTPYVIEFFIPGDWFIEDQLISMAIHMIQYWVHKYIRKDDFDIRYDGYIDKVIPPSNIIGLHLVPDDYEIIYF